MVVDTEYSDEQVNRVFHALADATRRDIVLRAMGGDHSVSALARQYPLSVTAIQKHVEVLAAAGLVTKHRIGREQLVQSNLDAIRHAARLLDRFEIAWRDRIDRIDALICEDQPDDQPTRKES